MHIPDIYDISYTVYRKCVISLYLRYFKEIDKYLGIHYDSYEDLNDKFIALQQQLDKLTIEQVSLVKQLSELRSLLGDVPFTIAPS